MRVILTLLGLSLAGCGASSIDQGCERYCARLHVCYQFTEEVQDQCEDECVRVMDNLALQCGLDEKEMESRVGKAVQIVVETRCDDIAAINAGGVTDGTC